MTESKGNEADMFKKEKYFLVVIFIFFPILLIANVEEEIANETFFLWLLNAVTQFDWGQLGVTAGKFGLVAMISTAIMKFFQTQMGAFVGRWKFVTVAGFSFIAAVSIESIATGNIVAALGAAPSYAAFQVFLHQAWKQIFTVAGNE